jgi:hypothetical protein
VNVTFSAFVVDETDQFTLLVVKFSGSEKLSQPACQGWVMAKAGPKQSNDAKPAAGNAHAQVLLPPRDNPIGHLERLRDVYVLLGELGVTIGRCPSLIAFDLLGLDSVGLRQRPLEERREAVSALIAGGDKIGFSEAIAAEGAAPSELFPAYLGSSALIAGTNSITSAHWPTCVRSALRTSPRRSRRAYPPLVAWRNMSRRVPTMASFCI